MKKTKQIHNYKITLRAIVPSYKGYYPLDIISSSDLIILKKSKIKKNQQRIFINKIKYNSKMWPFKLIH